MSVVLLNVIDLYCERDDRVLFEELSFQLSQGEILYIKGKNGSGKTSLLRLVCGLYQDFEGSVKYLGADISRIRTDYNKAILFISHNTSVKESLTVKENLLWYASVQSQLNAELLDFAIEEVGLSEFADVLCQKLSAGQRRRVNLARLFMHSHDLFGKSIWVLDEPFTAIDVDGVKKLENHMLEYVNHGGSIILTTHQMLSISENMKIINLDD